MKQLQLFLLTFAISCFAIEEVQAQSRSGRGQVSPARGGSQPRGVQPSRGQRPSQARPAQQRPAHRPGPQRPAHRPGPQRPAHRPGPQRPGMNRPMPPRNRRYGQYAPRHRYTPYRHNYRANVSYLRTQNYYRHLYSRHPQFIYRNWLRVPNMGRHGFHMINGYPYFVFNGYQHRYSNTDYCNYQLVDMRTDQVLQSYPDFICSRGFDECMMDAEYENSHNYGAPFMCLEAFRF